MFILSSKLPAEQVFAPIANVSCRSYPYKESKEALINLISSEENSRQFTLRPSTFGSAENRSTFIAS